MTHIDLLKRCHAYLRGATIHALNENQPIDADQLAREINLYLNNEGSKHEDPPGNPGDA